MILIDKLFALKTSIKEFKIKKILLNRLIDNVLKILLLVVVVGIFFISCKKDSSEPAKTLTVSISPIDAGSVLKNPNHSEYEINTEVNLTAEPNVGYYFSEWSGDVSGALNPITITMDDDKVINAIFLEGVFEDFNDGVADYFNTDPSGRWNVTNNAYKMTGTNAGINAYSYYPYNFSDFGLSVDMKVTKCGTSGHAYGIYFKSQSADLEVNSYRLSIDSNGTWYIGKYINGVFIFITNNWIPSSDLNTGLNATNNIKILFEGTQVRIYFNEVYQGAVNNISDFSSGYAGVQGYDSDVFDNEFIFDNFKIVTTDINNLKSSDLYNTVDFDITNIRGIKGDPNGNNF